MGVVGKGGERRVGGRAEGGERRLGGGESAGRRVKTAEARASNKRPRALQQCRRCFAVFALGLAGGSGLKKLRACLPLAQSWVVSLPYKPLPKTSQLKS